MMKGNHPSDEVGKSYTHPVGIRNRESFLIIRRV